MFDVRDVVFCNKIKWWKRGASEWWTRSESASKWNSFFLSKSQQLKSVSALLCVAAQFMLCACCVPAVFEDCTNASSSSSGRVRISLSLPLDGAAFGVCGIFMSSKAITFNIFFFWVCLNLMRIKYIFIMKWMNIKKCHKRKPEPFRSVARAVPEPFQKSVEWIGIDTQAGRGWQAGAHHASLLIHTPLESTASASSAASTSKKKPKYIFVN